MKSGIYQITSPSGKRYVGSAVTITQRWAVHKSLLVRGLHHCAGLQNASTKYGFHALRFEVIERCSVPELIAREQHHIDRVGIAKLYNSAPKAGSTLGVKLSDEAKAKLSAHARARVGWTHSEETKAKMSRSGVERFQNNPLSAESREKIAAKLRGRTGRKHTPEARAKMSASQKGRVVSAETRKKIGSANSGRVVSQEERAAMSAAVGAARNTSGVVGVSPTKRGRWAAHAPGGKYIGMFDTLEEGAEQRRLYLADPENYKRPKRKPSKRNTSGHLGIIRDKSRGKWMAYAPGPKYISRHDTLEEAVAARAAYLESVTLLKSTPSAPE